MKKSLRRRYLEAKKELARLRKKYAKDPLRHIRYSLPWLEIDEALELEEQLARELGRSLGK